MSSRSCDSRGGRPSLTGCWLDCGELQSRAVRPVIQDFYLHTFELVPEKAQPHSETVPSTLDGAVSRPRDAAERGPRSERDGGGGPPETGAAVPPGVRGQDCLPGGRSETGPAGGSSGGSLSQALLPGTITRPAARKPLWEQKEKTFVPFLPAPRLNWALVLNPLLRGQNPPPQQSISWQLESLVHR